jgi:3-oxoacyl-[acyl-carrier protein] reductase
MNSMTAKTILITGGSRGLGRAMAVSLAQQGHRVAVTGRDVDALREVLDELPGGLAFQADVSDSNRARSVITEVTKDIGPIDVLINNAGTSGGAKGPQMFWDMSVEDWWRVQETNIKGPMLYCHAVLPHMMERSGGIIINIGSYISIRPMAMATAYAASKAALARFTDCLAADLADSDVQLFCLSPGMVITDMTKDLPFINEIPEEDFNQPEDIAALVCELTTGNYRDLSGRFIHVNDDISALRANTERIGEEHLYQLGMHGLDGLIE